MACIMGIDGGNFETKICTEHIVNSFPSDIGEYRERKLTDSFGKDDIIWEYKGEKGFGGTLAKFESEYGGTLKGKSKANSEVILRVLIAIHKYGQSINKIVVGQPIESHYIEEKDKLKTALKGEHVLKINGIEKSFTIEHVEVAPEGPVAILTNPQSGLIRIIDIGSGTTNFATLYNLKRIDKDSFTEQIGMEIMRNKNPKEMAKGIAKIISARWEFSDTIYLTGGGAEKLFPHMSERMPNCKVLKPKVGNKILSPKFANAAGFYTIAKGLYENGNN